ncbi:MAG: SCP2 sterol-binding domain-containing protein [Alphaproteobacteria bacterium]
MAHLDEEHTDLIDYCNQKFSALEAKHDLIPQIKIGLIIDDIAYLLDAGNIEQILKQDEDGAIEADKDDDGVPCIITISGANFKKLLDKQLNPMMAYSMGKLKVKGDLKHALKLSSLLG